ncbi:MAG: hypothetical protein AABY14_02895 [Nanoarchaeota archaeon]
MKKAKIDITVILLISMLVIVSGLLIYSIFSTVGVFSMKQEQQNTANIPKRMSHMTLTSFDKEIAKQLMDTNNDGRCDVCGMSIEQCIDGGQLECSMDSNAKIGILGSQHIHADWKVYINGKELDFSNKAHMTRVTNNEGVSSFIHVDSVSPPEKIGDVLHMHATGVPLWIFFKSIDMDLNKDCLSLENEQKFCNNENKKLGFYVNGKENNQYENYIFNDLDKILVSYGDEIDLNAELDTITNFAKLH